MKKQSYTDFKWNVPKIIVSLPEGKSAEALFQDYLKCAENSDALNVLKYNGQTITGSNVFANGLINYILRDSGIRTSVPRDDVSGDILNKIRNNYYSDFNALVAQKDQPSSEKNKGLWKRVIELAEEKKGSVKFPFMISGFYVLPDKIDKDYGIKIVPASNFEIIEDERLSGNYNNWKFENVDENGLPVDLNKNKGSKTLYTRNNGLSRFYLDRDSDVDSNDRDLVVSNDVGRVVLVSNAESVANAKLFSVDKMLKEKRDKLNAIEKEYIEKIKNI